MTAKGLSSSRGPTTTVTCDPSYDSMTLGHSGCVGPTSSAGRLTLLTTLLHSVTPFSPNAVRVRPQPAAPSLHRHYSSHHELKEECGAVVRYTGPTGSSKGGGGGGEQHVPSNLLEQFERQAPVAA
ncbi:disks large-associated protein 1 [Lates japonicus]|uniref:Disks large-associated protein 1 n=1 Tax=Lates japonicus TaxID=270547 RepID=A0AAD3M8H1_LATJO|nr:disks large-associated protein 1 [Lates japonicus]